MESFPQIFGINERTLRRCKREIRSGGLVAFPTETVYGLGADALNPKAVSQIFAWKGRPITNPVIIHFSKIVQIFPIINLTHLEMEAMLILAKECWPGPFTLVLRASDRVPHEITAGKDFVGVRMPNDRVALQLITECDCLIAAPSANISGHCSPYSPEHVADDFRTKNLLILADSENNSERCGIESSVMKLEESESGIIKITVLRTGFIGGQKIKRILETNGFHIKLEYYERIATEETPMDCPGQLFRHYAPKIPAFIESSLALPNTHITVAELCHFVIIGANQSLVEYQSRCARYYTLGGSIQDVAKNIYSVLRLAEKIEGANGIIISVKNLCHYTDPDTDLDKAITDKLMRCSEGHLIKICV
jgi:L-threonylcarbamoyladenylate synthase